MNNIEAQYATALEWLFAQLPFYQNQGAKAFVPGLENIRKLTAHLGHPHEQFPSIHVAGTNGKGSTSHMLAAVLQQAGYRVGLYTSPHLKDFRERIKINGTPIAKQEVVAFVDQHRAFFEAHSCSFFEATVGLAFAYFAKEKVDIAIIEVGMGGRLDATNIITPKVAVITNISFDHTAFLGTTRAAIAAEKAGIIKKGVPVVIGEKDAETAAVFIAQAKKMEAPYYFKEEFTLNKNIKTALKGSYQKENALLAQAVFNVLEDFPIDKEALQLGLEHVVSLTNFMGRWQTVATAPKVILDVSHNAAGFGFLKEQLAGETYDQLHLILGFVRDKDLTNLLSYFPEQAHYYLTQPQVIRALAVQDLAVYFSQNGMAFTTYSTPLEALSAAQQHAAPTDLILATGSNFLVADLL